MSKPDVLFFSLNKAKPDKLWIKTLPPRPMTGRLNFGCFGLKNYLNIKLKSILELKSWLSRLKRTFTRTAFFLQYYSKKLFFQIKKRAPSLKKLHLESFPAIHIKKMDWMDFLLKFSSELFVVVLSLTVGVLNLFYFSSSAFADQSLAGNFLSHHKNQNPSLYAKNSSIVTVISPDGLIPHAQAEDFAGFADSQTAGAGAGNNTDIVIGNQDGILAPNPDSVQSLVQKQIKIYQTQNGDSLSSLSKQFGISQQTIMWANKLTAPGIRPGWELIILPTNGVLVKISDNDTLPDIAHAYNPEKYNINATVRENSADQLLQNIISYNALDGAEGADPGDLIIVPGGQVVEQPAPKAAPKPKPKVSKPDTGINQITSLGDGYDGVNHIFPRGYCTYYVASKIKITFGGNAKNWLANARASGYVTGQEAAPRSAVVMTGPKGAMRRYGHVALVESVNDNDTITVSEMNYDHFNRIDIRTISINDSSIRGYIYP